MGERWLAVSLTADCALPRRVSFPSLAPRAREHLPSMSGSAETDESSRRATSRDYHFGVTPFVICRSQAIFDASVVPDGLPAIDTRWIDQFIFPTDGPGSIIMNSYLGRGPLSHELEPSADLFFNHGEEAYPVFGIPSEGPKGAALLGALASDHVTVDEGRAAFILNVTVAKTITLSSWDVAVNNQLDPSLLSGIVGVLQETKAVLDTIIGTYALYQYPLVWRRLHERHSYAFVDSDTGATTRTFRPIQGDNFVPFRLNASSKLCGEQFVDAIHGVTASLVKADLAAPLAFLKDSLWHSDLRVRFLLQFWIVEYFAEKRASASQDSSARAFVAALEELVAQHSPEHLARFKSRKGELLRPTLAEKVRSCCEALRIEFDGAVFKRAKRVRDNLSHGSAFAAIDLVEMDQYIRELSRYILRRELEARGIFLEAPAAPISELPVLKVPFERVAQREKNTAHFQLP